MILVDTSVLYAFFDPNDSCHCQARELYQEIPANQILLLSDVLKELITIVNKRKGSNLAKEIYAEIDKDPRNITLYDLDTLELYEFLDFFSTLKNTKLSTTDLQLLFLHKKHKFKILTFDQEILQAQKKGIA